MLKCCLVRCSTIVRSSGTVHYVRLASPRYLTQRTFHIYNRLLDQMASGSIRHSREEWEKSELTNGEQVDTSSEVASKKGSESESTTDSELSDTENSDIENPSQTNVEDGSVKSHFDKLLQVEDPSIEGVDAENERGMTTTVPEEEQSPEPAQSSRVIYFDTQKVYSSLKYAGFSSGQADAVMQTLRDMLYMAMSDCRENAVQLAIVENEAYLFEAACSELRNEIQTDRTAQAESYRVNLARLSRDVELLRHEIEETVNSMKSEIDMEVNERKNATRAEESQIELKIQELNNKITIDINSEIKSEIEALRWQTTRRGLLAIIIVAFSILVATSATKKEERRQQKRSRDRLVGEEYQVPVLNTSEYDEIEERPVEVLS